MIRDTAVDALRHLSLAFLPALAVGLAACRDVQQSVAPEARIASSSGDRTGGVGATGVGGPKSDATTVVYSNFGPGMSFYTGFGPSNVIGPGVFQYTESQQFFTPPGDYVFTQARVPLFVLLGSMNLRVSLQADSSGKPGHVLETMPLVVNAFAPTIYTATSTLSPVLRDSLYWLTVWTPDPSDFGHEQFAGWAWNSIGDESFTNMAITHGATGGPWELSPPFIRTAFEIDGRLVPLHGAVVHQASGGGTVLWGTERVTYGITAQQTVDGSVSGHLLWIRESDHFEYRGTVTCLTVVGNRAFLSGDVTEPDAAHRPYFAIALEDNGEGANATMPDRVSSLYPLSVAPPCGQRFPVPVVDWTNGNVQLR
jgi:hypothetical protein